MKEFNFNTVLKIKLTEKGREILEAYYASLKSVPSLGVTFKIQPDEEGYIDMQLHDLTWIFGRYALDEVIESDILIPDQALEEHIVKEGKSM